MKTVFDLGRLSAVALDVAQVDRAAPDAVAWRQRTRLVQLLEAAQRGSRFYRQRLPRNTQTPLAQLPVVTRRELMGNFDDWVSDPCLNLVSLRHFTADPSAIGRPYLDQYQVWESSGTSGQPGIFVQDAQTMAVYDALESLRRSAPRPWLRWANPLCLGERIAFVGATGGHFASFLSVQRMRQLNPWISQSVRSFSILDPTDALVQDLQDFAPTVLATYPSAAALLADAIERGALRLPLCELWTGGETLSPAVRQRLQRVLGCDLRNSYGASEFLSMGWECAQGQLHLNADWLILEPVDEHYRPVPAGQPSYTALLTHLVNTVQPLIRYDIGDEICLAPEPCGCGSPLPVIHVQGRCDDVLVMAGAHGRLISLLPLALTTVLEDEAGVFDFQLCQKNDHALVLRLPQQGGPAQACAARCRAALQRFAATQGLPRLEVEAQLGQAPRRGSSGKACRIVARKAPAK